MENFADFIWFLKIFHIFTCFILGRRIRSPNFLPSRTVEWPGCHVQILCEGDGHSSWWVNCFGPGNGDRHNNRATRPLVKLFTWIISCKPHTILWQIDCYCSHDTDEETEVQERLIKCPQLVSLVSGVEIKIKQADYSFQLFTATLPFISICLPQAKIKCCAFKIKPSVFLCQPGCNH